MGMSGMEVGSSSVLLLLIEYPRGGDRSSMVMSAAVLGQLSIFDYILMNACGCWGWKVPVSPELSAGPSGLSCSRSEQYSDSVLE